MLNILGHNGLTKIYPAEKWMLYMIVNNKYSTFLI